MIGQRCCQSRPLSAEAGGEWWALAAAPPPRGRAGGAEPGLEPAERGRPEGGGDAAAAATAMEAKPGDPLLCDSLILWVSSAASGDSRGQRGGGQRRGALPSIHPSLPRCPPAGAAGGSGPAGTARDRQENVPAAASRCGCAAWNIPICCLEYPDVLLGISRGPKCSSPAVALVWKLLGNEQY